MHIKQPHYINLRFEWHPTSKVVYVIRLDAAKDGKVFAEPFAWEVKDSGSAQNAVLIWLRGYKHGKSEAAMPVSEHLERSDYAVLA